MKWNEVKKFKEFGIANHLDIGFISYVQFVKDEIEEIQEKH